MSKPIFYTGDLSGKVFTMSLTENPLYPLTNLNNYCINDLWKSPSAANGQTLNMDAGSALPMDTLILHNHNFSGMTSVKLQYGYNDEPGFSGAIDIATVSGLSSDPIVITFASKTKRYRRLLFEDTNGIIPQLGQIFLCAAKTLPLYSNMPKRGLESVTSIKAAIDGTRRGCRSYEDREKFAMSWGKKTQADEAIWQGLVRSAAGRCNPFYFTDMDGNIHFVRFDLDYMPSSGQGNLNFPTDDVEMSEERVGIVMNLPGSYTVQALS